jgi:hypothetical protein
MVKAWVMTNNFADQRDEVFSYYLLIFILCIHVKKFQCHKDPPEYVSLETLTQLGVEHFYVSANFASNFALFYILFQCQIPVEKHQDGLAEISELRGYNYNDKITIR